MSPESTFWEFMNLSSWKDILAQIQFKFQVISSTAQHFGSFTTFNSFCKPHQCIIREIDNSGKEGYTKYCRLFLKHQEFSKNQKNGKALRCMIYLSILISLATLYLLSLGTPDVESSSYGWRSPTVKPQHLFFGRSDRLTSSLVIGYTPQG